MLEIPIRQKQKKALELIPDAKIQNSKDACALSEVIVITTPADSVIELISQLSDVSNKTIIDTTNAIRVRLEPYPTAYHALKDLIKSEKIVKCFNSTGFENMINPVYNGNGIDMFCVGNSKEAKDLASSLAKEIGFADCWDFGGDDKVELLENLH